MADICVRKNLNWQNGMYLKGDSKLFQAKFCILQKIYSALKKRKQNTIATIFWHDISANDVLILENGKIVQNILHFIHSYVIKSEIWKCVAEI